MPQKQAEAKADVCRGKHLVLATYLHFRLASMLRSIHPLIADST